VAVLRPVVGVTTDLLLNCIPEFVDRSLVRSQAIGRAKIEPAAFLNIAKERFKLRIGRRFFDHAHLVAEQCPERDPLDQRCDADDIVAVPG